MNNFFKQLLGSIVQIGMQELSKKKVAKQQPTPSLRDTPPIGGAKREKKLEKGERNGNRENFGA